ncbi:MAG TPA: hypothetical protein VIO11_07895 [Candidatus Methanoperedens sp.]
MAFLIVPGGFLKPDWKALYSESLSRRVIEIDGSYINREYYDKAEMGSLTRVAWAKLDDGTTVFLGLPPYGLSPEEVVRSTVVLTMEEAKKACADAFGEEFAGWWFIYEHHGNSFRIYPANRDSYCEFYYLPQGWELRTVNVSGVIKPFR